MGTRLPTTPRSKVKAALTRLFLHSRERSAAIKRDGYKCQECGVKQSKAKGREVKVQVHHTEGKQVERVMDYVYAHLLCDPKFLETVCEECHRREHAKGDL